MSPTSRTLEYLRRQGFLATVVETFNHHVNRKRDLFGIGDVLAVHPVDRVVLIVQTTTKGHVADRLARCVARPELATWLRSGAMFECHGWYQDAESRWRLHRVPVQLDELGEIAWTRPKRKIRRGQPELF